MCTFNFKSKITSSLFCKFASLTFISCFYQLIFIAWTFVCRQMYISHIKDRVLYSHSVFSCLCCDRLIFRRNIHMVWRQKSSCCCGCKKIKWFAASSSFSKPMNEETEDDDENFLFLLLNSTLNLINGKLFGFFLRVFSYDSLSFATIFAQLN